MAEGVLQAQTDPRPWSLEDILVAPEVTELALSEDGRSVLYAVEAADPEANRLRSSLVLVDLDSGLQRTLLEADHADLIRRIPGSPDWSAQLDIGDGIQLYHISSDGQLSMPIGLVPTVLAGTADMAVATPDNRGPIETGVLAHDWSADGEWLWYSILKASSPETQLLYDEDVTALRARRRSQIAATVEFRLRNRNGSDVVVTERPASDEFARFYGGNVLWEENAVEVQLGASGPGAEGNTQVLRWKLAEGRREPETKNSPAPSLWLMRGPRGGEMVTSGTGPRTRLQERFADGTSHDYGLVDFGIGDPRSSGYHRTQDGTRVVLGTRTILRPRYGLAILDENGLQQIDTDRSLTRCDFNPALDRGICVREGIAAPPELVRVDLATGTITRIASVSPRHDAIAPLDVRARTWTNRLGFETQGYVVLPRGHVADRKYPTVIVTHGSDADERFAHIALQWHYPVQVLAEQGYVVLLMNDPSPRQHDTLAEAYRTWASGAGPTTPDEMQRLLWLNGAYSFVDAIDEMAAEGLVDAERVGIAGYSRGSQMVNVSITNSQRFRAASGGDGSYLEPHSYPGVSASYDVIFGGSPFGPQIENYRRFSPSLNAHKACTPLLQQVADPLTGAIDLHQAWRDQPLPAQLTLYPGATPASSETHIFHLPSNRLGAMRENIAWFDFWLKEKLPTDPELRQRAAKWQDMTRSAARHCKTVSQERPAASPLHQRAQDSAAAKPMMR